MLEIRKLDEKAKRALAAARAIVEAADRENRDITADEERQVDAYHEEADRAVRMRERLKTQEEIERRDVESRERERVERDRATREANSDPERARKRYATAFRNWMRVGISGLPGEQRQLVEGGFRPLDADERGQAIEALDGESRIMGTGSAGTPFGGYAIPQDFMARLVLAMDAWNGVFRAPCEQFTTASGAQMPWPTGDDRSVSGELLGEGSAAAGHGDSTGDVVLSRVVFDAYTYSSKVVKVQRQLLQDEAIDLEGVLAGALGERLGRITGAHLTTGTGTGQPNGIVTAATDSATTDWSIAGGDPNYLDLVALEETIAEPYRIAPSTGYMFGDSVLFRIRKQLDLNGQPIWNPGGMAQGAPPTINGHRYYLNQLMPAFSGTNKVALFGDLGRYKIRRVAGGTMIRLEERYAELLQVGFLAFLRLDGDLVDGGAGSIKYAQATT